MNELLSSTLKLASVCGTAIFGLSVATIDDMLPGAVQGLERMGSFFLVAIFVVGVMWQLGRIVPAILASLERTKDQFVSELKEERAAREKNVDAFREMLRAHKDDIGEKLDAGNKLTEELVNELRRRPCQK